ncbi:MAG: response regulator [Bacteroidota bacterium]
MKNSGNLSRIPASEFVLFYADDDQEDREFFTEALTSIKADTQLFTHENGDVLLNALKNPPPQPSIIFLDLNMPVKNGIDVLNDMKDSNELQNTPVVVFSTSDDRQVIENCKSLGASLFITKPNSFEGLKKSISHVLSLNWAKPKQQEGPFHLSF